MPHLNSLDKKITSMLPNLTESQKKAVLNVMETFVEEEASPWNDKSFVATMDRRIKEYEEGKILPITIDELEARARAFFQKK